MIKVLFNQDRVNIHDDRSGGIVVKLSVSQTRAYGFESYSGYHHVSSDGASTDLFKYPDSDAIYIPSKTCFAIEFTQKVFQHQYV
jgi:hypothetical protein